MYFHLPKAMRLCRDIVTQEFFDKDFARIAKDIKKNIQ